MPHPSKLVFKAPVPVDDDGTKRLPGDEADISERTPREMLEVLTRIVNRQVEQLDVLTHGGRALLDPLHAPILDEVIDRVCKLAREDRAIEPSDEELLAAHDKESKR